MTLEQQLRERSQNQCELCLAANPGEIYRVPPAADNESGYETLLCSKCLAQIEKKEELDATHWNKLNETMWSETPAVQVLAWRMLNRLRNEAWAAEALDMLYLEDGLLNFAKATGDHESDGSVDLHRDSNGHVLKNGDSVVLIKTLDVKGSTIKAKLGTVVKNIRLVEDNTEQIEGKIEGQTIVILTKYLSKQNAGANA